MDKNGDFDPPPVPAADPINYSPKHSRKPSSLLSSRNINMKRLLLGPSPPQRLRSAHLLLPSRKGKLLAIAIPPQASPRSAYFGVTSPPAQDLSSDPLLNPAPRSLQSLPLTDYDHDLYRYTGKARAPLRSPFDLLLLQPLAAEPDSGLDSASRSLHGSYPPSSATRPSLDGLHPRDEILAENDPLATSDPLARSDSLATSDTLAPLQAIAPSLLGLEELQESLMVHAYPHGPANVLNSRIFLYSDPETSDHRVDVNDYDLVINVARECADLSLKFDTHNGDKKYIYVPWSHTSPISHELPDITREIAAMDKAGKRILIHCQCGVLRLACVVVAYFIVKFKISVNEAYELLKSGTDNKDEPCLQDIKLQGNHVLACDRICPNMSLIFELMDFCERLK